jgi:predicted XRE-type DNA-binding protein
VEFIEFFILFYLKRKSYLRAPCISKEGSKNSSKEFRTYKNPLKDPKMKKYKNSAELAVALGLPAEIGQLSDLKAKLTKEIIKNIIHQQLTHQELSQLSGVPRSAITGIINGSMQKVTLDRLIRILSSLGLRVEMKIKIAA